MHFTRWSFDPATWENSPSNNIINGSFISHIVKFFTSAAVQSFWTRFESISFYSATWKHWKILQFFPDARQKPCRTSAQALVLHKPITRSKTLQNNVSSYQTIRLSVINLIAARDACSSSENPLEALRILKNTYTNQHKLFRFVIPPLNMRLDNFYYKIH